MPNIMTIRDEARELIDKLEELSPEEATQELAILEQKGMACIAPLCDIVDELSLRAKARKEKADEYAELAKKDLAHAETAKKTIIKVMQMLGTDKVENGSLVVKLTKGSPSLEVFDESLVPDRYKKLVVETTGDQLQFVEAVLGDNLKKATMTVMKSEIKSITNDETGIAGTRIVYNPRLTIKG